MSFLASIFGGSVASPIEAIGNVLDKVFTSDEQRMQAEAVMEKLRQHPSELQAEINKIEASHRSIFVSGWRPAIGWCCSIGLFYDFLICPIFNGLGYSFPSLDSSTLHSLIMALLGLGALRTTEKFGNKSK